MMLKMIGYLNVTCAAEIPNVLKTVPQVLSLTVKPTRSTKANGGLQLQNFWVSWRRGDNDVWLARKNSTGESQRWQH